MDERVSFQWLLLLLLLLAFCFFCAREAENMKQSQGAWNSSYFCFFYFFLALFCACSCGVFLISALIMYAHEMVTVIFVIDRSRNRKKAQKIPEMGHGDKGNNLPRNEREMRPKNNKKERPFGCEIEMGFGHFVKCHKCNISTICCLFPFIPAANCITYVNYIFWFGLAPRFFCSFVLFFCCLFVLMR